MIIRNHSADIIMLELSDYSYYDLMDSIYHRYTHNRDSLIDRYRSFKPIGPTILVEWGDE